MRAIIGGMADRVVNLVVPKTTAGACACGDCVNGPCGRTYPCTFVPGNWVLTTCYNCNCSVRSRSCRGC